MNAKMLDAFAAPPDDGFRQESREFHGFRLFSFRNRCVEISSEWTALDITKIYPTLKTSIKVKVFIQDSV